MTRRRNTRQHHVHPGWLIVVVVIAALIGYRHTSVAEAIGAGLLAGAVLGYRWGRRRATVITTAPRQKAAPAPRKPPRVKYHPVSADNLLDQMENWSSACLDGRCGDCSGENCTHCTHPGKRQGPGKDLDLEVNEDIPPF